jgi:hypothetical protein
MSDSAVTTLLVLVVVAFAAILPMAPAIGMYKVAPKNAITASGVLAGLTINASGAIATYVVIFAALLAMVNPLIGNVLANGAMWTVYGELQIATGDGKPVAGTMIGENIRVEMEPRPYGFIGSDVRLTVPRVNGHFPSIMLNAPERGVAPLNLSDAANVELDAWKREVRLLHPIKLVVSAAPAPYQPTGSLNPATDLALPAPTIPSSPSTGGVP